MQNLFQSVVLPFSNAALKTSHPQPTQIPNASKLSIYTNFYPIQSQSLHIQITPFHSSDSINHNNNACHSKFVFFLCLFSQAFPDCFLFSFPTTLHNGSLCLAKQLSMFALTLTPKVHQLPFYLYNPLSL